LRYVPPAVLSAIIFPELLMPGGTLTIGWGNVRLFAGLAAALVAWRTRNVLLTIVVGMGVLYLLQALTASLTGP
jgi:branched-subunit amino acid transport protein